MTDIYSSKVGKRWFKLIALEEQKRIADVEASYSVINRRYNYAQDKVIDDGRQWVITGLGARKYREQIIDHLEERYFDGNPETD